MWIKAINNDASALLKYVIVTFFYPYNQVNSMNKYASINLWLLFILYFNNSQDLLYSSTNFKFLITIKHFLLDNLLC